jgi:type IV pilus assembly protein PilO
MDFRLDGVQRQLDKVGKLPPQYRVALAVLLPVLLVGSYWWFLYRPAQEEHKRLVVQQQGLQRKLNEVRSVAANLEKFEQEIADLEAELRHAVLQLPSSKELPGLLTDITTLGKKAGLEFNAFRPQGEYNKGFYAEVPIEIEFTGSYHQVATFFDRIAKLDRIVNVGDISMTVHRENLLGTTLKVSGKAITFRFLEGGGV